MKRQILHSVLLAIVAMMLFALPQYAQAQTKEAYVVRSGMTLTFYYDMQKATRPGTKWGIEEEHEGTFIPAWAGTDGTPNTTTTQAVFDPSFKDFRPKTTARWFNYFKALTQITGIENLNTEEVTDMSDMFAYCTALPQLDVSKFETKNVTNMGRMFSGCTALTRLDVSKFDTENVTDMYGMFDGCAALATIYSNEAWTCGKSSDMFYNSEKLKGAVSYDSGKIDVTMANPDTGYFTKKVLTGIAHIGHAATVKAVYSVDGRRLKATQPGVNIMKMSDGTTRKVVKK